MPNFRCIFLLDTTIILGISVQAAQPSIALENGAANLSQPGGWQLCAILDLCMVESRLLIGAEA